MIFRANCGALRRDRIQQRQAAQRLQMSPCMTTRRHNHRTAADTRLTAELDDVLPPLELSDLEDAWLDKLRTDHARRATLEVYDYVELIGF